MQNRISGQKGFTILELLVVVALLVILATMGLALLNPTRIFGQGRDAKRISDLKQVQNALQLYFNDNKVYPNSNNAWVNVNTLGVLTSGGYIKVLPDDPSSTFDYFYLEPNANNGCTDNQAYVLRAQMESTANNTVNWCNGTALTSSPFYFVISD